MSHQDQEPARAELRLRKSREPATSAPHPGGSIYGASGASALSPAGNGSPSAHTAPSTKVSFFQMGTVFLSVSISQRHASNACARCAEATTMTTLVSHTASGQRGWAL